jgi:hypothetical protein
MHNLVLRHLLVSARPPDIVSSRFRWRLSTGTSQQSRAKLQRAACRRYGGTSDLSWKHQAEFGEGVSIEQDVRSGVTRRTFANQENGRMLSLTLPLR